MWIPTDRAVFNVRDILVARVARGSQAAEVVAIAVGRTGLYSVTGPGPVGRLIDHVKADGWVRTDNDEYVNLARAAAVTFTPDESEARLLLPDATDVSGDAYVLNHKPAIAAIRRALNI